MREKMRSGNRDKYGNLLANNDEYAIETNYDDLRMREMVIGEIKEDFIRESAQKASRHNRHVSQADNNLKAYGDH